MKQSSNGWSVLRLHRIHQGIESYLSIELMPWSDYSVQLEDIKNAYIPKQYPGWSLVSFSEKGDCVK